MTHQHSPSDRELVFTRILNAPRELVFEVWTKPEHIVQWWGPSGFTTTDHGMNATPGGAWSFTMHGPDGRDYPNRIVFLEVVPPERLVYRHSGDVDTEPVSFHVTVTFTEKGNQTELSMHMTFQSADTLRRVQDEYGAIEGAHQTLARLDEYVAQLA